MKGVGLEDEDAKFVGPLIQLGSCGIFPLVQLHYLSSCSGRTTTLSHRLHILTMAFNEDHHEQAFLTLAQNNALIDATSSLFPSVLLGAMSVQRHRLQYFSLPLSYAWRPVAETSRFQAIEVIRKIPYAGPPPIPTQFVKRRAYTITHSSSMTKWR